MNSPRTKIISCSPGEFVAELAARYRDPVERRFGVSSVARTHPSGETEPDNANMEAGAIFISYTHEDQAAARRLRYFLEDAAGIDMWIANR